MAIPPQTEHDPNEGELDLTENCFVFGGLSLEYLKPFRVVDLSAGEKELTVTLQEDIQVCSSSEEIKPGSIHTAGTIKVYFHPAVPGHRYRCDFSSGQRFGRLRP
jgi:hypothetical protein